jgi:signal peptidase I
MSTAGDWSRDPLGDADRLRARGAVPWGRTEETGEEWPPLRAALPSKRSSDRDSYDRDDVYEDDADPETTNYISSLRDRESPDGEWYRASSESPREYETRAARRRAESHPADDYRDAVEYDRGTTYGQVQPYGQTQAYSNAPTDAQGRTYNTAQTYGVPAAYEPPPQTYQSPQAYQAPQGYQAPQVYPPQGYQAQGYQPQQSYEAPQAYQAPPQTYQAPPQAYQAPPPAYEPPFDSTSTQRYQGAADTSGWLPPVQPAQPTTYRKVAPRVADEYDSTYSTGAHRALDYDIDGRPIAYRALPPGTGGDVSRDDGTRDDGAYGATTYGAAGYTGTTYGATTYGSTTYGGATGASTGYTRPDDTGTRALSSGSGDGGYGDTYSTGYNTAHSYGQTAYAAPATPEYTEPEYAQPEYTDYAASDYADDRGYEDSYDYDAAPPASSAYDQLGRVDEYGATQYGDYEGYDDSPRRRDYNPYEDDRPTTVFRSALTAPAYEDEEDRYDTRPPGQVYGRGSGRHRADLEEEEARPSGRRTAVRGRRQVPLWQELPLLVIIAFSLALVIKTFLLQAFFIPSGSMENTLKVKDRVLVNKVVYEFREPQRGEVIVFRGTDSWAPETELQAPEGFLASAGRTVGSLVGLGTPDEKDFIKRVVGVPGDVVQCCDQQGRVLVNGKAMDEGGYVFDNNPVDQRAFGPITVPQGRLFVMGDHRGNSQDSRAYIGDEFKGTIPIDQVIGRAFVKVWPVARWDDLPVPGAFDTVPAARALGPPPEPGRQRPGPAELPLVGALLLPIALRGRRRRE